MGAGRLRILSERLAVPTRQARETWFAAWQCVADTAAAGDAVNAAQALALAGNVLCLVLDRIATEWLAEARAWLRSARAACDGFADTTVVGLDEGGSFVDWASPEFVGVPRWLADRDEFGTWAMAIDRVESLRSIPGLMQPSPFARSREVGFCLDVLALIAAGASAGDFRTLLEIQGGTGRMAGLTAALAVCFAPPPAGHEFRAVDLPGDAGQRETAGRLLRMADSAYGGCAHIKEFHQKHTAVWVLPAPSALSSSPAALGTTAEEATPNATAQVAAEALGPSVPVVTAPEADGHQPAEVEAQERHPDGPGEPLEFWYAQRLTRFDKAERRHFNLLVAMWPKFRLRGTLSSADAVAAYEAAGGSDAGWKKLKDYARELNGIITHRIRLPAILESGKDYLRWETPERT